jgi:predicted amidohydrolase
LAGIRFAIIQPKPVNDDFADRRNVEKAAKLLEEACRLEPDVAVFPEYFPFYDDPSVARWAAECSMYVVAGVGYREGGALYNTATVYGPDGSVVARQGKKHIGRLESRLWGFSRWKGDYVVLDIGKARLGVSVCADFWSFPEAAYELFLGGAEIFVNPSYMFSLAEHWVRASLVRSLEFYAPVVAVDSAPFPMRTKRFVFTGGGYSHVVVPPASAEELAEWWESGATATDGWIRLKLGVNEAIAVHEVDVEPLRRLRQEWWVRMRGVSLERWLEEARKSHRAARLVRAY